MKNIILFLTLFIFSLSANAKIDYAKDGFPPLLQTSKITQAESAILGQTYEYQTPEIRLNRLEKTVFNRTYPKLSYEQRVNNIIVNYKRNNTQSNSNFKKLNKYERNYFGRTYSNDTLENRISRLEEYTMGAIQSGDFNTRFENLQRYIASHNSDRTYTTFSPYCGTPVVQGSGWRGLAGSLGNFFSGMAGGTPTGLTPPVYSPYINNYGPDYQRGYYSNKGWNDHNTYYGSGSGVHILD